MRKPITPEIKAMKNFREIQRELIVPKAQYNEHGKYFYRSTEDILDALKPFLTKYDFTLIFTDDVMDIGGLPYIKSTVRLEGDGISQFASSVARDSLQNAANISLAPIATNAASSFARKQALSGLFLIDDTNTPTPSKEELIKHEKEEKQHKKLREQADKKRMDDFIAKAEGDMNKALSVEELKKIYAAHYRDGRKLGQVCVDAIEKHYRKLLVTPEMSNE